MTLGSFTGRVAVVTGAASGIGRALAAKAASEGMRVVLADVEAPTLEAAVADVVATGAEAIGVRTDVTSAAQVDALADAAYERFGAVHLLCNNAGVFQGGISWQRTESDWRWVFEVNVWGVLHGIRSFVPRMLEQGEPAHVVNTSSMAGLTTVAYTGPYVVSKFAVAALTESLAHDLRAVGAPIGVSCLVPGAVDTRIGQSGRNRPGEPPAEAAAPDAHFVEQMLRETTAAGRPPEAVADLVFDAVRAGRFWIPTTDGFESMVRARFEALLRLELPAPAEYAERED